MTTHVFIVDWRTFDLHLKYLFVGTGAGESKIDFNNCEGSRLHSTTERSLVGMIADAGRIRAGDQVVFYLQQNSAKNIYEGKFFGVFQAVADDAFLDNLDSGQYLSSELDKSLTFRTFIAPLDVYAEGVTEWEALDEIKNISSPCQMLWSLIYRKLKGNRGNTMITMYEAERLLCLIRNKNKRRNLSCANALSFDQATQRIVCSNESQPEYTGRRQEPLNILPRLRQKHARRQAYEVHLQAYITQHLGKGTNESLDISVFGDGQVEWLGNEVSCGVGMQRIDVMISVKKENNRCVFPIELKCVEASMDNLRQLQRYIDWVKQYYIPNQPCDIQPVLLGKKIGDKRTRECLINCFNDFNEANNNECRPLRYVEFTVREDGIVFQKIEY